MPKSSTPSDHKSTSPEKTRLHPRNRHRERYDFNLLTQACPALAPFVALNIHGGASIDFANPEAVKMLNLALLRQYYGITYWDVPPGYLCPPIPGRADYIHHVAELLSRYNYGKIPNGTRVKCLDIGVGANCIYPIIGNHEYGWSFIGTDIDPVSIESANQIIAANPGLSGSVECRLQTNPLDIFYGILTPEEKIDLVVCNPPFHASAKDAQSETLRKQSNLKQKKITTPVLNFGGQNAELWCVGGEEKFVNNMVRQSWKFRDSVFWFSSLIAKKTHLEGLYEALEKTNALEVKTIPMGQGNKTSRILAWTFLDKDAQKQWRNERWNDVVKRAE